MHTDLGAPGYRHAPYRVCFFLSGQINFTLHVGRVCMHAYVFMCALTSVEARGEQHKSPSVILHLINFFLDSLLLGLELTNPAILSCQNPTESFLSLPP